MGITLLKLLNTWSRSSHAKSRRRPRAKRDLHSGAPCETRAATRIAVPGRRGLFRDTLNSMTALLVEACSEAGEERNWAL